MALEDFFTLSEMKDGLTTLARVEELISVMLKQKDSVVSSVADSARQWCSVARILSATENKDCLDHFIQLNGLFHLNQWLQEAQKYSSDASDGSVEELINLLLGALQMLPVNREKSLSSGIGITVKQVICLNIPNANDRANSLLAKWDLLNDDTVDSQDQPCASEKVKGDGLVQEDTQTLHPAHDTSLSKKISEVGDEVESTDENSSRFNAEECPDVSKPESNDNMELSSSTQHMPHTSTLSESNTISGDVNLLVSPVPSNPCQENLLGKESSIGPAMGVTHADTIYPSFAEERNVDCQNDFSQVNVTSDISKDVEIEIDTKDLASCKSSRKEICVASSSGVPTSSLQPQKCTEPTEECTFDSKELETSVQKTLDSQPKSGISDCETPKLKRQKAHSKDLYGVSQDDNDMHQGLELLRINNSVKEIGTSYRRERNKTDSKGPRGYPNQAIGANTSVEKDRRFSNGRIEYGDDALEFAVQVAIEVTREVADREQHSTSSEGRSEGEIMDSASELKEKMDGKLNRAESPSREEPSDDESSSSENRSKTSENIEASENPARKVEPPKSVPVIQEPVGNTEKTKPCFDLNEDVCDDDTGANGMHPPAFNSQSNLSVPIAVVATSKGTPGLPVTPLHFEGELGWRGSAATSAFRPASPRRTPDGERTVSGPKQKSHVLQFDLNIADEEDDAAVDPVLGNPFPVSSGLPSGDSSVEVSSRRAEKLKLDLNHGLGDEDTLPNASSYWKLPQQNGNGSSSPISLSSVRQHSMRDFDLNDNPSFLDAFGLNSLNKLPKDASKHGSFKVDDPAITIMGSRLSVERKESANQAHQPFLANGLGLDSTMTARPSMVYSHMPPSAYGYNGLAMAPNLSLPPALYGPGSIPYMVDSRGATVIPQIFGSSAELNGSSSARPPFLVNVAGAHPGMGPIGAPRPTLDLNSGMLSLDSGNREMGSVGQVYFPWHNGLSEEQMRAAHPAVGPGMTLKRKEPDCGWESYPVGYKQVTSWP